MKIDRSFSVEFSSDDVPIATYSKGEREQSSNIEIKPVKYAEKEKSFSESMHRFSRLK
jgi:hypothetical protein